MCEFMSFVVTKGNQVFYNLDGSSSHETIIKDNKLCDDKVNSIICRVEICPPSKDVKGYKTPLSKWIFRIDESVKPDWFDLKYEKNVKEVFKKHVKDFLKINCKCEFRLGFCIAINSTVKALDNSTVEAWGNSTVEAWGNSTVEAWGNSTVKALDNSTVEAWGNSTVEAWGNSTVKASKSAIVIAELNIWNKFVGKITLKDNAQRIDRK